MVHADASNFAPDVSKEEAYKQVLLQAKGLFEGQRNWVCNLANTASLLWYAYKSLPEPSSEVNWAGFYVHNEAQDRNLLSSSRSLAPADLILGPFQGKVACQTISYGRGVCGLAAATGRTQVVADVDLFSDHIACDGESQSEIVVPIFAPCQEGREGSGEAGNGDGDGDGEGQEGRKLVAVIDVDCKMRNGFDDIDVRWLEELAKLLGQSCDW